MVALVKHIIVLSKIAIETNHSKPDRGFGGILSNVGLCLPPSSEILNFGADVQCEEVCVCCRHVSRRVRDYIRHAERHQDVGMIKTTYINQMCDELRKRAADELDLAEGERLPRVERSNKRARDVGDVGSRTSGVQNAKLHKVGIMDELGFQPANGIHPLEMSSLSSHQTRCTYASLLYATDYSTYASLKCYRTRSQWRLSEYFNRDFLSRVYRRTNLNSGRFRLRCSHKRHHKLAWIMDGMDTNRECGWEHRERNTLGSNSYAFVLAIGSLNAKFIRIFWNLRSSKSRCMSSTFCISSGEPGSIIFCHVSTTSIVANSNVIAYPSMISKPIRASKIVLKQMLIYATAL
jgi:hypothetical protein